MTNKSTAPIPTIHALYVAEKALTEAWRADIDKYQHTAPHTSQRTLHAWWTWLSAMWEEESEAGR
jgi:hypothetical protein